jgi:hypothetical protein
MPRRRRSSTQVQDVQVSPSFASGTLTDLHFGLGDAPGADAEVRWPDGETRRFENVRARRTYRLAHGGSMEEEQLFRAR